MSSAKEQQLLSRWVPSRKYAFLYFLFIAWKNIFFSQILRSNLCPYNFYIFSEGLQKHFTSQVTDEIQYSSTFPICAFLLLMIVYFSSAE